VILIALLLFCAVSFYVVDYKKGSHDDVINTITQLSNYSVGDIVNGTVDLTRELKEIVKHTFEANSEKGALLGGWLANQSEIINT
jgi:pyridoxal/pyridoxine/pyridoxamine kinase